MIKNLNDLAKVIAKKETGNQQVSIAQIKEIIKLVAIEMALDDDTNQRLLKLGARHVKQQRS